jgi:hypothetical protein
MSSNTRLKAYLHASVAAGAISVAATGAIAAPVCQGPGAPSTTQTKCVTAVTIPGAPLQSFDISWTNPDRAEYYLGDRANSGVDIIDTRTLTFKRTIGGFTGIVALNPTTIDNNHSGPDGVVTHNRWLYAGDGDSTLKVFDLDSTAKQTIATGGTTRVDEMALTTDGKLLVAANNAEDPPFATLFKANGDNPPPSKVAIIARIQLKTGLVTDPNTVIVIGDGQSMEQPAWDPTTKRVVVSIPFVANNPAGCNPAANPGGPNQCDGGLLFIDPTTVTAPATTYGFFDPATNTGVLKLHNCGPNGASVGPHDHVVLGCTPGNNAANTTTQVINATTKNFVDVGNITGSDEVWFNKGDNRYYLGASKMNFNIAPTVTKGSVLGVINAGSNFLIETIPASSNSHSVAADSRRNLIFLPEVCATAPAAHGLNANVGCDTNTIVGTSPAVTVSQAVCGGTAGCVAVYKHDVDDDDHHDGDDDHDDHDHDHDH